MDKVCNLLNKIQVMEFNLLHAVHDDDRKTIYLELDRLKRQLEKARVN